jgi:radical SAM superfamily enzyme YgiQ (UPF0313 family)
MELKMIKNITPEFMSKIKLPNEAGKRLNYLIVMPKLTENDNVQYIFPVGMPYVSAALKASGRSVFTLNLNYKSDPDALFCETVRNNNIDVVMVGGLSGHYAVLQNIISRAKEISEDIITVCGGGIITADPKNAMAALRGLDFGLIGEGEYLINEFAYALENDEDISTVAGVALKDGSITGVRPDIADLDILPFPDYEGFEFDLMLSKKYPQVVWLKENSRAAALCASRSCPYNCTFCFHSAGKKYRKRSLDNIFAEIDYLADSFNINYINFSDELFVSSQEFLRGFCERIKSYNISWNFQSRVDRIDIETFRITKESGCVNVFFGVESGDNTILKSMKKHITTEQVEKAFGLAKKADFYATGNIIFGDREETTETVDNTLKWVEKHPDFPLSINWITAFPGCELYFDALKRGVIKDPVAYLQSGCPQINVSKMTADEYSAAMTKVELFKWFLRVVGYDELLRLKENLHKLLENNDKIALWPMTFAGATVLHHIAPEFVLSDKVFWVNIDETLVRSRGIENFRKKIYKPDIIKTENIPVVIYSYQNSGGVINQISEMIRTDYPSVKTFKKLEDLL